MYICNNCHEKFHEPEECKEVYEYWGETRCNYYLGCPCCESDDYDIYDEDEDES